MPSAHGWMLLCLATAGALHPVAPSPRVRPAPVVKGVALRAEARARATHPEPQVPARATQPPLGLPAGLRF